MTHPNQPPYGQQQGYGAPPAPPQQNPSWPPAPPQGPPPQDPYQQQGYGAPPVPPQNYYQQQSYVPPQQPQAPPQQMPQGSLEGFLTQPAGGGKTVNAILDPPGARYVLRVVRDLTDADTEVLPDYNDKTRPAKWRDGRYKTQLNVPVYISHPEFTDGKGMLRVRGQMQEALVTGMAMAGAPKPGIPEKDSIIDITREQDRPIPGRRPQFIYTIHYTRPEGAANGQAQQQAQQMVQPQAPWEPNPADGYASAPPQQTTQRTDHLQVQQAPPQPAPQPVQVPDPTPGAYPAPPPPSSPPQPQPYGMQAPAAQVAQATQAATQAAQQHQAPSAAPQAPGRPAGLTDEQWETMKSIMGQTQ